MRCGLKHVSVLMERKWEHSRFESENQINSFRSLLGLYCAMGFAKEAPVKNNHVSPLNSHDTTRIVEPLEVPATFSRRNLTEFGTDVVHCDGIGGKFWVMFKAMTANNAPRTREKIEVISISENSIADNAKVERMLDVNIELGRSVFCYENCALKVKSIVSRRFCCKFIQSFNESYPIDSSVTFDDTDEVKKMTLATLNY